MSGGNTEKAAHKSWLEADIQWGRKNPQVTLNYLYFNLPFQGDMLLRETGAYHYSPWYP